MKAEEARALSFNNAISELDDIKNQIKNACKVKQMCISISGLSRAAIESLIADGYKLDQTQSSNYNIYTISW